LGPHQSWSSRISLWFTFFRNVAYVLSRTATIVGTKLEVHTEQNLENTNTPEEGKKWANQEMVSQSYFWTWEKAM